MHLFFPDKLEGNMAFLNKEESHHADRVLKMKAGDDILITQGSGKIYNARFTHIHKSNALAEITGVFAEGTRDKYLHIAIGPTKSLDRFEFFLEKATEAGVDEITPLISFHSERKVYKTERGNKIIKAAVKQSLSPFLPILNEPRNFTDFIVENKEAFIAHCREEYERIAVKNILDKKNITVLIGPEGDFSKEEIEAAMDQGLQGLEMGSRRLRTETAGVAVALVYKI